jgi:SAM-dependent methyltransferase
MNCPLCSSERRALYSEDRLRKYLLCGDCYLVFVPRETILSFEAEAQRYDAHNNDEGQEYRDYLTMTVEAVRPLIPRGARGLDFGCGKTTLMAKIFGSFGITVDSYDLYFHPKEEVFAESYDFIVLSEVIEHLRKPLEVMERLRSRLTPGGKIFIKTKLYSPNPAEFRDWFYKRDPTHVQFFNYESLNWLANRLGMQGPQKLGCPDLYEFKL